MKKILALVIAAVMIAAVFAGCGSSAPDMTGKWTIKSATIGGETMSGDEMLNYYGDLTYTFSDDGTVTLTTLGLDLDGTYSLNGSKLTLSIGGQDGVATVDGNQFTLEEGDASIVFEKQ